jgi:hypothetical protein
MLKLINFNHFKYEIDPVILEQEENRKKTPNMILAEDTLSKLITKAQEISHDLTHQFDLYLCTGEGELSKTIEFYQGWVSQNRARPIIFQNSLHNSTLGALSLTFPGVSAGFTISNGETSCEMAIDMALSMTSKNPIIIIGLDVYIEEIKKIKQGHYDTAVELASGACSALFIPSAHPLFDKFPGPIIKDIKIEHKENNDSFKDHYPANGLEKICKLMKEKSSFKINRPKHYEITVTCYDS